MSFSRPSAAVAAKKLQPQADPGTGEALPGPGSYAFTIAAGASETNTMAAPKEIGDELALSAVSVGASGTRAVTFATGFDESDNTVCTINGADDTALFKAVRKGAAGVLAWMLAANNGCAVA